MKIKISHSIFMANVCAVLLAASVQAQVLWSQRVASTIDTDDNLSIGMTLDTNANCYVTGWFDGTNNFGGVILTNDGGGGQDIFVAKYNSSGALQWAHRAGGSSPNRDAGRGIGVDTNGNVYVTGCFYGPADFDSTNLPGDPNGTNQFFLAKYNSTGTVQWVQQSYGGYPGEEDGVYGTGLAVDGAGNCYVVGVAENNATITFGTTNLTSTNTDDYNIFLVKYNNAGALQWAQLMGGSGNPYATKVAVDAAGNVYERGEFQINLTIGLSNLVSAVSGKNMFIAKFNNSGALTWVQQAVGGGVDEGGVAVDRAQNVYVSGWFTNSLNFAGIILTNAGSYDAFLAKYNSNGIPQWARQAGGGTNSGAFVGFYWDVALDAQTNVYPSGGLSPNGSESEAVAKYNPAGTLQWAYSASGPPASPAASVVAKCAVDSAGNCFLAGWYQGTNTFGTNVLQPQGYWNYFLAKVAPPAPPTLGIALSNGVPRLNLAGSISSMYSVQYSPTLSGTNPPFQTLTTLAFTNSPQLYLDTSVSSGTNRFYRAGPPAL
jgi:hypothetical protein